MSARTRYALMGLALALLVGAFVWNANLAKRDPLADIALELNAFGYSLTAEDFYVLGGADNASVASLLGEETGLAQAVEASLACGFPSNVEARGEITALLANTAGGVITVYLRNGSVELCFVQTEAGEVKPLK